MELRFDNINHINKRYIKAASTVTFIAELLNITSMISVIMPVVPSEPQDLPPVTSSRDQKQSEGATKATAQDHISKGPVIPHEMPPKASREEIEAKKKELNQK